MPPFNLVRRGAYHDSVTLMRLSRDMEAVPGVSRAAAMMGTPHNLALLRDAALLNADGEVAGPTDLVVAVVADDERAAREAWAAAERALARTADAGSGAHARRRSLRAALADMPDADIALISVPGPYAAAEAMKALSAGLHVMVFSDNVPVEDEVRLKHFARERGRFALGPDCGTAILGGVPLGFANAVPRGRIGLAAASGTGLQAVTCHLAAAGEGVSHAIGLGGRDLSDEVGGLMLEPALAALAADSATSVVVVIGKPPGPMTAKKIDGWLAALGKPCVAHFTGGAATRAVGSGAVVAATLEDTAVAAVALARGEPFEPTGIADVTQTRQSGLDQQARLVTDAAAPIVAETTRSLPRERRFVRGLFGGGTLAQEAATILRASFGDVTEDARGTGHRVVDLGDDAYTVGRPHPMIDGTIRREWIVRDAADPTTAVILLDVVLGYGAHPDPAGELMPAIERARAAGVAVVANVCGTERDPQGLSRQTGALWKAGVLVMPSNAQAASLAARIAAREVRERR